MLDRIEFSTTSLPNMANVGVLAAKSPCGSTKTISIPLGLALSQSELADFKRSSIDDVNGQQLVVGGHNK